MRFVSCIVREHQLRLYGHVAHFPDADPAHQILSVREFREWRRPRGRPRALRMQHVDQHLKEMGTGQASAWGLARQRPLEYRRKVDPATHCSGRRRHSLHKWFTAHNQYLYFVPDLHCFGRPPKPHLETWQIFFHSII